MVLPKTPSTTWFQNLEVPSRLFPGVGDEDYELYEEDGEFVLSIEMPGFERDEISCSWDDGRLYVAAEHREEERGRKRTYHRTFRFPKRVDADGIEATYRNGVLEVTLPAETDGQRGQPIEVQ